MLLLDFDNMRNKTNRYILITVVSLLFVSKLFSQDTDIIEERERVAILPEVYGTVSNPAIITEDKEPIIISDRAFILTPPTLIRANELIDILPFLKETCKINADELYVLDKNILTEKFFALEAAFYSHNKGAEIIRRNNRIEVIADRLNFGKHFYLYILQEDGKYKTLSFWASPHYDLLNGTHADTVSTVPMPGGEPAKDILYYYMKENELLYIIPHSRKLSRKGVKNFKKILNP